MHVPGTITLDLAFCRKLFTCFSFLGGSPGSDALKTPLTSVDTFSIVPFGPCVLLSSLIRASVLGQVHLAKYTSKAFTCLSSHCRDLTMMEQILQQDGM